MDVADAAPTLPCLLDQPAGSGSSLLPDALRVLGDPSTEEGRGLIDQLAGFDTRPILVLTGGDPLMRRDLFDLAMHADRRGLRVALTPTATALATPGRMRAARQAGIRRIAFSVDAADAEVHRSEEHTSELQSLRHLVCRL